MGVRVCAAVLPVISLPYISTFRWQKLRSRPSKELVASGSIGCRKKWRKWWGRELRTRCRSCGKFCQPPHKLSWRWIQNCLKQVTCDFLPCSFFILPTFLGVFGFVWVLYYKTINLKDLNELNFRFNLSFPFITYLIQFSFELTFLLFIIK